MNAGRIIGKTGGVVFAAIALEYFCRGEILFAGFWLLLGIFVILVAS